MPYPWLQVSEFRNWQDVADWAAGLFITTNSNTPELQREVEALRRTRGSPEQTVQKALQFVQSEVRYLGLEFGPNSYRPTDPAVVLQHRFGDCKDKAFLLCTLLRELGLEATPVMVATGFQETLPDLLPAPHDFNHVIVRVVTGDHTYWVDPTRSYQHGPIAERYRPAYAFGLLAKSGVTGLTPIPTSNAGIAYTLTSEDFHVGGQKSGATLSVTSTFHGFDAEWMRAVLDTEGRQRLEKSYLNDYAQRYPGVTVSLPVVIEDDPGSDRLTIIESYIITNFWTLSPDKQRYNCQFYPQGIHSWLEKPTTSVRLMPMEISFPRRRVVETRIELPQPFKLSDFTNTVTGPAVALHVERSFRGKTVWLKYEYDALTNYVPASLAAEHLASLVRMENALGYSLSWQSMDGLGKTSQFNWPIFLLAAVYTTMLAGGAGRLCYKQCDGRVAATGGGTEWVDARLEGLGGWLFFVGLGLMFRPFYALAISSRTIGNFSLWRWHAMTMPGGMSYNPLWGPLLTFELLIHITMLVVNICAIILFFQKRRAFPIWFVTLLGLNAIFIIVDALGVHFLGISTPKIEAQTSRGFISVIVGCSIWIPYMFVSRRVNATFVR